MQRYYDRRLFDVDAKEVIVQKYASQAYGQPVLECRTAQELAAADFDVRAWGSVFADGDGLPSTEAFMPEEEDCANEEVFEAWLTNGTLELAAVVSEWWDAQVTLQKEPCRRPCSSS